MRFTAAIDLYCDDMIAANRFTSPRSESAYRSTLYRHVEDVENRDPRYTGRDDVKRTLARWRNPRSRRVRRSQLRSFYGWLVEEGWRKDNPVDQTRAVHRAGEAPVYRMTRDEAQRMLRAAAGAREQRAIFLGICAGLRRAELLGLQGRHFGRPGWVWVSSDIAKGGRERWVPVIVDLLPVVEEIRKTVARHHYVLPAQRFRDPGINKQITEYAERPSSPQALYRLVLRVGERAGIAAPIRPHLLRHAYADHIARHAGTRLAQFLLGHAAIGTTETYLGNPTLDELAAAVSGFAYSVEPEHTFYPRVAAAAKAVEAPTGIEPV